MTLTPRRGLLLVYDCNGVWRYLEKRRLVKSTFLLFQRKGNTHYSIMTIHIYTTDYTTDASVFPRVVPAVPTCRTYCSRVLGMSKSVKPNISHLPYHLSYCNCIAYNRLCVLWQICRLFCKNFMINNIISQSLKTTMDLTDYADYIIYCYQYNLNPSNPSNPLLYNNKCFKFRKLCLPY